MTPIPITSLADPRIAVYRDLKRSNATRALDLFVVEGEKLVRRLLASRFPTVSVLASDRYLERFVPLVPEGTDLYVMKHERISDLIGFNFHQGALACGRRLPDDASAIDLDRPRLTVVVTPTLKNPEKLGSIIRSSRVLGVDGLVLGPSCPDPLSRRVLRVSMGMALELPILSVDRPETWADQLRRDRGASVLGAVADPGAEPFGTTPRPDRLVLVFGSEAHGIGPEWSPVIDRAVTIPMATGERSLNLPVSVGIILYHHMNERKRMSTSHRAQGISGAERPLD